MHVYELACVFARVCQLNAVTMGQIAPHGRKTGMNKTVGTCHHAAYSLFRRQTLNTVMKVCWELLRRRTEYLEDQP